MHSRTHYKISKAQHPGMRGAVIEKINSAIDNPDFTDTFFAHQYPRYNSQGKYENRFDKLGLGDKTQHRRVNHDMLGAIWAGYRIAGSEGSKIALEHVYADKVSDILRERYGTEGRDAVESIWVYLQKRNSRFS